MYMIQSYRGLLWLCVDVIVTATVTMQIVSASSLALPRPAGFLQTCLLFLLLEQPAHGYGLLERLGEFGLAEVDVGGMYRILNRLEDNGFVTSGWETGGSDRPGRNIGLLLPGWSCFTVGPRRLGAIAGM